MSEMLNESSAVRQDAVDEATTARPGTTPAAGRAGRRRLFTTKFVVGSSIVTGIVLFGVIAPFFTQDPRAIDNAGLTPPGPGHILGTTQTGQDVLAQLAEATRGSLLVGVCVAVLTLVLSAFFGILGAYIGGAADETFSLVSNVALVVPGLPLIIVIASYVQQKSLLLVIVVLSLTSWAGGARVLRAQTLSLRNRDYVLAARVSGEKTWRIICVEVLPNLLPVMSSGFVFAIIFGILSEAGLSFIGVGVSGSLTWGTMLATAQSGQALLFGAWWWFAPPGLLIAVLGAGLSLVNFSIDEVINPKLRAARTTKVTRRSQAAA